jgi:hypothetical protein
VSRTARAGRSLSGHILGGSVSALPVYSLQSSYGLRSTFCLNSAPSAGLPPPPPLPAKISICVFGNFLGVQLSFFFVFHFTNFILFRFILLYSIVFLYFSILLLAVKCTL